MNSAGWPFDEYQHPGRVSEDLKRITDGVSPLELEPKTYEATRNVTTLLVHSPGFAWTPIRIDLSQGGERELRLEPGGNVEIVILGELPKRGALLRLRQAGETASVPFGEFPAKVGAPLEINALPLGPYHASVEVGNWFDDPARLGGIDIEVRAERREHYELLLDPPKKPVFATLAGTLVVPPEWELESFQLSTELDGTGDGDSDRTLTRTELTAAEGSDDTWSFEFDRLPTGTYLLEFSSGGYPPIVEYSVPVELPAGGIGDLRLEIPPPATVAVRLVDASTGALADVMYLHWGALHGEVGYARSLIGCNRKDEAETFEFRAPIGRISLGSFGSGYTSLNEVVQVQPGHNEYRFQLEVECPLLIQFRDGETPVPAVQDWYPKPEHLDGEGVLLYYSHRTEGFKTGLSEPGRYVFEFPEFPGFQPIGKQTVTVQRGESTIHVVQLERK